MSLAYQSHDDVAAMYDRGCAGKESYPSASSAWAALRMYARTSHFRTQGKLTVYECMFCNQFHMGHEMRKK